MKHIFDKWFKKNNDDNRPKSLAVGRAASSHEMQKAVRNASKQVGRAIVRLSDR